MSDVATTERQTTVSIRFEHRQHAIEQRLQSIRKRSSKQSNATQIAFTFFVIALAAKLVKLGDASDHASEIESFRQLFAISDHESVKVETYFYAALEDEAPAEHYARQIVNLFPNNKKLLQELVQNLLVFADADSPLNAEKALFLKKVTEIFALDHAFFRQTLRTYMIPHSQDPYTLLGVTKDVAYVDLKRAYRRVVRECHPDKYAADEQVPELIEVANEQFNLYTQAYEAIKKALHS